MPILLLLFIVLLIIIFLFQSIILHLLIGVFKLEKKSYKTALAVNSLQLLMTSVIGMIFGLIFGSISLGGVFILLFSLITFHFLLKKYYQSRLAKNIGIYLLLLVSTSIFLLIIIFLTRSFIIKPFYQIGDSMEPLLKDKEYVLLKMFDKSFERNDIVVFTHSGDREYYIRRIVGMPGEKIELREGELIIEDRIIATRLEKEDFSIELRADEYFVLAENQSDSETADSLDFGPIHQSAIIGTYWFSPMKDR